MNAIAESSSIYVIPQCILSSAPALEVRDLGGGEEIRPAEALAEVAELNKTIEAGLIWRLETPHEFFAIRSPLTHKNANGAHSYDESIKRGWYWTGEETPWYEGGRVVVGFDDGLVLNYNGNSRAFARAVCVAGQ